MPVLTLVYGVIVMSGKTHPSLPIEHQWQIWCWVYRLDKWSFTFFAMWSRLPPHDNSGDPVVSGVWWIIRQGFDKRGKCGKAYPVHQLSVCPEKMSMVLMRQNDRFTTPTQELQKIQGGEGGSLSSLPPWGPGNPGYSGNSPNHEKGGIYAV
jgi:hypothetical protein